MIQALAILAHALRMLTHEPATTLRVIMPSLLIILLTVVAALVLVPDVLMALQAPEELFAAPPASGLFLILILSIAGLIGYALMAILWHRHVLLNGTGIDSDLRSGTAVIAGYLWRAIILALVQFLVAIPIGVAIAIFGGIGASLTGGVGAFFVIGVLASLLFIWIALRLSVVLPAAALGNTMRISESWAATEPASSTLWGVAALLALLNMVIAAISTAILPDGFGIAIIMQTVIYIIEGLVFVSVLTTLYGHLVEGRSLS